MPDCGDVIDGAIRNWNKVLLGVLLLVGIILFSVSWASLEYTEYGLDYNGGPSLLRIHL